MALGRSTPAVCFALGVTGWVGFCRMSRGETLKLRELDYVRAARALGVGHARIILFGIETGPGIAGYTMDQQDRLCVVECEMHLLWQAAHSLK